MIIFSEKFEISSKAFCGVVDITDRVESILKKSKIKDGIVTVFTMGSTAGITTIEFEPNLIKDFQELIEKLVPKDKTYYHDSTWGEGNGFSHLRASLIGPSITVPVKNGRLALGTWQQIVLINFDNRERERKMIVQIVGEA